MKIFLKSNIISELTKACRLMTRVEPLLVGIKLFEAVEVLGKSFSLNPEGNKQKENDYLLTIVFLFHAIIGEAQSSVFYVTHALPFKI